MSTGLTLREEKGSKLSIEEMDGNLTYLESLISTTGYTGELTILSGEVLNFTNGILTEIIIAWSYEGVLTAGSSGSNVGYENKAMVFGSFNPVLSNINDFYWDGLSMKLSAGITKFSTDGTL